MNTMICYLSELNLVRILSRTSFNQNDMKWGVYRPPMMIQIGTNEYYDLLSL